MESRDKKIEEIKKEILNLKKSPLFEYRIKNNYSPVVGEGNLKAKVMFVGEAPGREEAEQGRPFVGSAGKILDGILNSINLSRNEVYISNLVNDRPPENRTPTQEEIEIYSPFLIRQIQIIEPKIIVSLGRPSTKFIMARYGLEYKFDNMGKIHGEVFSAKSSYGKIFIISMYHPAAALYQPDIKNVLKNDMQLLKKMIS